MAADLSASFFGVLRVDRFWDPYENKGPVAGLVIASRCPSAGFLMRWMPDGAVGIADQASPGGFSFGFCCPHLRRMGDDPIRPFSDWGLVGLANLPDGPPWCAEAALHFTSHGVWLCPMGAIPSETRQL